MKFGTMHLQFSKIFFFSCCKMEFVQCGKNPLKPLPSLGGNMVLYQSHTEKLLLPNVENELHPGGLGSCSGHIIYDLRENDA